MRGLGRGGHRGRVGQLVAPGLVGARPRVGGQHRRGRRGPGHRRRGRRCCWWGRSGPASTRGIRDLCHASPARAAAPSRRSGGSRRTHAAPRVSTTTSGAARGIRLGLSRLPPPQRRPPGPGHGPVRAAHPGAGRAGCGQPTARCGRRTRVLVAAVGALRCSARRLWWADAQQDAQRVAAGRGAERRPATGSWSRRWSVAYRRSWRSRVARWLVRQPRRVWRPAVALGAMTALLAPAAPAHAHDADAVAADRVLTATSSLGAVRAYGAERPGRVAAPAGRAGGRRPGRTRRPVQEHGWCSWCRPARAGWTRRPSTGFERRFGGDVALVGMQYASTPSWVAFLFQRGSAERGCPRAGARPWPPGSSRCPRTERPQLHLYGESLGALAGQAVLADPARRRRHLLRPLGGLARVAPPPGAGARPAWPTPATRSCTPPPACWCARRASGQPWLPGVSYLQSSFDLARGALPARGPRPPLRRRPGRRTCRPADRGAVR